MLQDALLAQGLVVAHAKHIDRLVMFRADRVLLLLLLLKHLCSHLVCHQLLVSLSRQIVTHFYLLMIALKVIDRG